MPASLIARIAFLIVGIFLNALTVWGVGIYLINSTTAGFQSAIGTVTQDVSDVSSRLQSESEQLRSGREALAADIADRLASAQTAQNARADNLSIEIRRLTDQLRQTTDALAAQLQRNSTTLAALSESVSGLTSSIQSVDARLSGSIDRQENFERFVVGVLLQTQTPQLRPEDQLFKEWGINKNIYEEAVLPISDGKVINTWWNQVNNLERQ